MEERSGGNIIFSVVYPTFMILLADIFIVFIPYVQGNTYPKCTSFNSNLEIYNSFISQEFVQKLLVLVFSLDECKLMYDE